MRRSNFFIKLISVAMFIVILCYIGYNVYDTSKNILRTSAVYNITVQDTAEISGYIIRDEYIITGADKNCSVLVKDGEKLSKNQNVAANYSNSSYLSLEDQLNNLQQRSEYIQNALSGESFAPAADDSVIALSYAASRGDAESAENILLDLEASVLKKYSGMSLSDLRDELSDISVQIKDLKARLSAGASYISASESGIFSSSADGYENLSSSDVLGLTVASYGHLLDNKHNVSENTVGKIITGITWYYAVIVDKELAANIEEDEVCSVIFPDILDEPVKMTASYIGPPDMGKCVLVLSCNKFIQDFAAVRSIEGTIILDSYDGIRVAKSAVHTDSDGVSHLYILRIFQAKRIDVTILSEEDDYYIISPIGTSYSDKKEITIPSSAEIIVKANGLYDGKVVQ